MSSSPKTISSSEQYVPSAGEQANIDPAFQQMQSLFNSPQAMFPYQTYAGASPYTQTAVSGMAGTAGDLYGAQQPFMDSWQRNLDASNVAENPYVQNMMTANQDMANKNLQQNILPGLQQGQIASGGFNSARQGVAEGVASANATRDLANTNANMMLNAYGQGLGAEQGAMGQSGNLATFMGKPWEALSQSGSTVEGFQNKAIQDAMNRYGYDNDQANSMLNNLINQLGGMKYGTQVNTQTNPSYQDPLTSMLGIGMSAASLPFGGAAGAPMSLGGSAFGKSPTT